jgi:hypothetical protein
MRPTTGFTAEEGVGVFLAASVVELQPASSYG